MGLLTPTRFPLTSHAKTGDGSGNTPGNLICAQVSDAHAIVRGMDDEGDYGLETALKLLSRDAVLGQLCQLVTRVRRVNADRQEPALGDDTVSLATQNWRNIINLLERHFEGRATVKAIRPKNSFQLVTHGYTVSVYGVPTNDPQAVAWRHSGVKQGLAVANSAMAGDGEHENLTFDDILFEDGLSEDAGLKAHHVVIVHWADQDARTVRLWAGLPRDNTKGGSPWLELVELSGYGGDGGGEQKAANDDTSEGPSAGFQAGQLPEVSIEWLPADEPDTGTTAQGA